MKLETIIIGMLWALLAQSIPVSAQSIRYSNFYDSQDGGAEIFKEAVELDNGSLLIVGGTANSSVYPYIKTINVVVDEQGLSLHSIERESLLGDINSKAVVRTESGGVYEAGYICYAAPQPSYCDYYLAKLDATGDTIFTKVIERPDTSDYLLDIVQTRPNKLLLIGWTYNDNVAVSGGSELMFITVDTLGNELNRVIWGGGIRIMSIPGL